MLQHVVTFKTVFYSCVYLLLAGLSTGSLTAAPLSPDKVPPPLRPWVDWALHDETELECPWQYSEAQRLCSWPSQLELQLNETGGTFTQQWQVFGSAYVRLPGDTTHWPQAVSNDKDELLLVEKREGFPVVKLEAGTHSLKGRFNWQKLPKALRITPQSGLITLSVNNQAVPQPNINQQGQLWLSAGKSDTASEDNLDLQVFRKIVDSHPIQVVTSIKLRVSGKQRNATLHPVLLKDFIPLRLDSKLPARINNQQLEVQLRPGEWSVEITGRVKGDQTVFTLPDSQPPWPQQEVWVLETDSAMRQVEVSGVNSVDPNQTRLPSTWKALPAYLMNPGEELELNIIQRGAAQTGKQDLRLNRELWLDFAGTGYTLRDQINGNIRQQSRINVLPELALGRVRIDGEPQFITRETEDGPPGVELRRDQLDLTAESRFTGDINAPPVNGWQQDLQRINTKLHLPPGWRLFSVSGTDNKPQSWLQNWSLLDFFLVLVIALGTGYLFGWLWGGLALLTLVFTWHESNAPQFIWLNLLAATALLRVLPSGWLKRSVKTYRWISLLILAVIVLPYLINTVRIGLYPQLENQHAINEPQVVYAQSNAPAEEADVAIDQHVQTETVVQQAPSTNNRSTQATMGMMNMSKSRPAPRPVLKPAPVPRKKSKYDMKAIDPDSMIQTGPGLPYWRHYRSIDLFWAGPVKPDESSQLILLGPKQNLLFKLIGIMLLLLLSWRLLMQPKDSGKPNSWFRKRTEQTASATQDSVGKQAVRLLPLLLLPALLFTQEPVKADVIPDQQTLNTLHERLTAAPDCLPDCAQIERMHITLGGDTLSVRLTVHASTDTAIPLPGSQDTWLPQDIRLNYQNARALQRDKRQQLWLALPAGRHEIQLRGALAKRNNIPLPLPLKPHQVSWESLDKQWTLEGIRDSGSPESQLQLNRIPDENSKEQQEQRQTVLPTFIKIERHLHLGLNWNIETVVKRLAPMDTPLGLDIPLLPNEQPMIENPNIKNRSIKINLAAQQNETRWSSRLEPGDNIKLTAINNPDYLESWHLATSPVWHVDSEGLPVNRFDRQDGLRVPVWLPWPGETLTLNINRPTGVPGQTVTILTSTLAVDAGKRANDINLDMLIRSSRGVQHQIGLPGNAEVQELSVGGIAQRIQRTGDKLSFTLKPGQQNVNVQWRESAGEEFSYRFPAVQPGIASVNTRLQLNPQADRWILWTSGPAMGPAVLFWGVLIALLIVSLALGYSKLTPVKSWQWFLLGIGLSQTEPLLMIIVAGWLIAIAMREKMPMNLKYWQFNTLQLALAGLTLIALLILAVALSHGLLGQPDMQIAGNGSSSYNLNWYQDRSGETLPQPLVVSVPLWAYRVLMLAWALWLAVSVLRWLGWTWQALNKGGLWTPRPKIIKAEAQK